MKEIKDGKKTKNLKYWRCECNKKNRTTESVHSLLIKLTLKAFTLNICLIEIETQ